MRNIFFKIYGIIVLVGLFKQVDAQNCPQLTNISFTVVDYNRIAVLYSNGPIAFIEYGPVGYTPGITDSVGQGGTILSVGYCSGYTFGNLNMGSSYHFYIRQRCNFIIDEYSLNSGPFLVTVPPCLPILNYNTPGVSVNYLLDYSTFGSHYEVSNNCGYYNFFGPEKRIKFTARSTNLYELRMVYPVPQNFRASLKYFDGTCLPDGYGCIGYFAPSPSIYSNLLLLKDSTYEFFIDCSNPADMNIDFKISCYSPTNIVADMITPVSIEFDWQCNCMDTVLVEYGLHGFTPGTGETPGMNGTTFKTDTNHIKINRLLPFTLYDFYFRSSCGSFYSENVGITQRTSRDCDNTPVVVAGANINFNYPGDEIDGAWQLSNCSGLTPDAKELIYQFTPTVSGMYEIFVYDLTTNWYNPLYKVAYYYKNSLVGCDNNSWICIGNSSNQLNTFVPDTFSFGPLTAGEKYYIMVDGESFIYKYFTYYARLQNPLVCFGPTLEYAYNTTINSTFIHIPSNVTFPNALLEYGPIGFTPGIDSSAGPNGTVIDSVVFTDDLPWLGNGANYQLTGLNPGETYQVYARSNCINNGTGFSDNSGPVFFTTCYTAPVSIQSNLTTSIVCSGQSVTLSQIGGVVSPGGELRWYEGNCGFGNHIGVGDSIVVNPLHTTTYFLRVVSPCGVSNCISKTVNVVNPDPQIIGQFYFCENQSTQISVLGSYTNYNWSNGDSNQFIIVNTPGNYEVEVVDTNGCTGAVSVTVQQIANPSVIISCLGSPSFCQGDSVALESDFTFTSYQWLKNNLPISNSYGKTIWVKTQGDYKCIGVDSLGCSDSSNSILITIPCISAGTNQSRWENTTYEVLNVVAFKNSYHNQLEVHVHCFSDKEINLFIYDVTGRVINKYSRNDGNFYIPLPVVGFYSLMVECGGKSKVIKMVNTE